MPDKIKQYTIEDAYTDNYKITRYVNGVQEGYAIVAYYERDGYTNALESLGYKIAYNIDEYYKRMMEAKEEYHRAERAYRDAIDCPLFDPKDR